MAEEKSGDPDPLDSNAYLTRMRVNMALNKRIPRLSPLTEAERAHLFTKKTFGDQSIEIIIKN